MRVLFASAYYSYRGLFVWLTPEMFVAQKVLIPLGEVAFFSLIGAFGGAQPLSFYLIGNAIVVASTAATFITIAIAEERGMGTLTYLAASPANRLALFFGRSGVHLVEGMLHVGIAFAWAALAFGLQVDPSAWAGLALAVVAATLSVSGLGLLMGGIAYVMLDANILANAVVFLLLLVSGANIPPSELPAPLAALGQALPLSRSIEAARLLAGGAQLPEALPLLAGDLLVGFGYGAAGFLLFQALEVQARRRGTLERV